jgi:hypothetical protein
LANLGNASGSVILGLSEPKLGTTGKSPMQRFLEHHDGPGVQHIAIESEDIFATLRRMRDHDDGDGAAPGIGFMPRPGKEYYQCAPLRPCELSCACCIRGRSVPLMHVGTVTSGSQLSDAHIAPMYVCRTVRERACSPALHTLPALRCLQRRYVSRSHSRYWAHLHEGAV